VIVDPVDIIYCEVCELPHRRGASRCEECQHLLGTSPNWSQIAADMRDSRLKALLGAGICVGTILFMIWVSGRVWFLIVVGLVTWSVNHARRWRAISKQLAKRAGPPQRG
jgi:hypothetical protein